MSESKASHPVGVFDSGVGGLSVWRELVRHLPAEDFIYYADSANAPYGPKPQDQILESCLQISNFLVEKGAKLIVIACNTATTAAINQLRERHAIPFVGMEPALKPAVQKTKSGVIGILGTEGTLNGKLFLDTKARFGQGVEIDLEVASDLVELVEDGAYAAPKAKKLLEKYIRPMMEKGADHLVLGCTHYPFLIDTIKEITGNSMEIVDPAPAVAARVQQVLDENNTMNLQASHTSKYDFYSNGNLPLLESMVKTNSEIEVSNMRFHKL